MLDSSELWVQVGLCVVMAEDEAGTQTHNPRGEAGDHGDRREHAGYNHDAPQGAPAA